MWDRGKIGEIRSSATSKKMPSPPPPPPPLRPLNATKHDINYLKRLESNLESYLDSLPANKTPSNNDDILIDVDIESFDKNPSAVPSSNSGNNNNNEINHSNEINESSADLLKLRNAKSTALANNLINDYVETASLSNFHNVRDVLLNIQRRLESYLTNNEKGASSSKLEVNIEEFLHELDRHVSMINEKKEKELRRFSENMTKHTTIIHMKNAFQKKESYGGDDQIYDTLEESDVVSYYSSDSISDRRRCCNHDGFIMRNCYDDRCSFNSSCGGSCDSVEYYSMLINEDRSENLLNDAPPPRYYDRGEKISLIFAQNTDHVIRQWQKYQLNTITIKPKKSKFLNFTKKKKKAPYDIWSFTLDYHKTKMLQLKLEKEKKIRLVLRIFFCFFVVICFILVVYLVQSFFKNKSHV